MSNHRKPPRPASWCAPAGVCRWCGLPVLNPKDEPTKGRWHPACVEAFKLIHWPAVTRQAVLDRDKGVCSRCGLDTLAGVLADLRAHYPNRSDTYRRSLDTYRRNGHLWQHDHIRPLVEANGDLSFWELENLATVCDSCHKQKTAREAKERAAKRKIRKLDRKTAPVVQMDLLAV